jgi:malate synthase
MQTTEYKVLCEPLFQKYFGDLSQKIQKRSSSSDSAMRDAIDLAVELERTFGREVDQIMAHRQEMQRKIDHGQLDKQLILMNPSSDWKPKQYVNNYSEYSACVLEMTGNALNRMGINAFNYINAINQEIANETGDRRPRVCWMCCGEDANGAQIESILENLRHYRDLLAGEASVEYNGKQYRLNSRDIPPCSFRPRGLHCIEAHVIDKRSNEPLVAPLFDVAFWSQFCLPEILQRNVCPLLYIPKMQTYHEAALWHKILTYVEKSYNLQEGTIKTVFLAETFPAVFQLPRMIEAFEGRLIGVNCGRWDYLFSYVQVVAEYTRAEIDGRKVNTVLPCKHDVTTDVDLLKKYQVRTAQMCHHYGIMFIGGMNATLPSTHPDATIREKENKKILESSIKNKCEERQFYGASKTWVAHIGLLEIAKQLLATPYNTPIDKQIRDIIITRPDLLHAPTSDQVPKAYNIDAFRGDIRVVLLYMTMYLLNRNGAVAVDNKMEDLATAEISNSLLWFYVKHGLLDKEIKAAGGVEKMVKQVSQEVKNEIRSQYKVKVSEAHLDALLNILQRILTRLILDSKNRATLEKVLYILGIRDDPYDKSIISDVLKKSKRFSRVNNVAFLISSL